MQQSVQGPSSRGASWFWSEVFEQLLWLQQLNVTGAPSTLGPAAITAAAFSVQQQKGIQQAIRSAQIRCVRLVRFMTVLMSNESTSFLTQHYHLNMQEQMTAEVIRTKPIRLVT